MVVNYYLGYNIYGQVLSKYRILREKKDKNNIKFGEINYNIWYYWKEYWN